MQVAVIIPVYKPNFSRFEKISLVRCLKILRKYSIILVCPTSLNTKIYERLFKKYKTEFRKEAFEDHFFIGLKRYNELMTFVNFYTRFSSFEYLLIYQLDAYIFHDELNKWCQKSFSFIGAPLPTLVLNILKKDYLEKVGDKLEMRGCLMNGGFSLRHTQTIINTLQKNDKKTKFFLEIGWFEDVIINLLIQEEGNNKIPSEEEAIKFSFECFPKSSYIKNNYELPLGCHAWYRNEFEVHDNMFWFKHIIPFYFIFLYIKKKIKLPIERIFRLSKSFFGLVHKRLW